MAKKFYWLKLKNDWFTDNKPIKKLRRIAGGDTYVIIYLKMQLASLRNGGKLFYEGVEDTFYEELALDLDEDEENVRVTLNFLESQGLIEMVESNEYLLTEVPAAIGQESESAARMRKHRTIINKKQKTMIPSHCDSAVTMSDKDVQKCDTEIEIEKEIEININNTMCKAGASALFERLWKAYPNKRGKGRVSDAKKRKLAEIGEEHLMRAIDRYIEDLGRDDWRKPQNGSTFFNSGYVDYLDENYEPPQPNATKQSPEHRVNSFHNFDQRQYDFDALEARLTGQRH